MSQQFLFPDERYAKLAEFWLKYHQTHEEAEVTGFIDFIPEELQGIIINMEMISMPPDYSKRELDDQLRALEKSKIDQQLNDLLNQLKDAQRKQSEYAEACIEDRGCMGAAAGESGERSRTGICEDAGRPDQEHDGQEPSGIPVHRESECACGSI